MIVLGIDPGSRRMGWGVVAREGTRMRHVAHGTIVAVTSASESFADRLVILERELVRVLQAHHPTEASVEGIFYAKDAQAASKLGHARGVALLVCARAGLPIAEYAPARVKRTVAGGGRAEKHQVAQMIRVILSLQEAPAPDAADALALAVTHLSEMPAAQAPAGPRLRIPPAFVAKGGGTSTAEPRGGLPRERRFHGRKVSNV